MNTDSQDMNSNPPISLPEGNRGVKSEVISPLPSDSGDQARLSSFLGGGGGGVMPTGPTATSGPTGSNGISGGAANGAYFHHSEPHFTLPINLRPNLPPPTTPVLLYPPPGAGAPPPVTSSSTAQPCPSVSIAETIPSAQSMVSGFESIAPPASQVPTGANPYYDVGDSMSSGYYGNAEEDASQGMRAVVEEQGYISLHLRYDALVDISPNQAIRIVNHRKAITLALSGCATQMALVHPQGRVLQYNSRIEVQTENYPSIKNAKMWPRGVSFTSNNRALVYLVDQAGARSTTDTFHDLYADNIADTVFMKSCQMSADSYGTTIEKSIRDLEQAEYWRTETDLDCWLINNVSIKQTPDGLVSVERKHGVETFTMKTSPSNGKARMQSSFLYLTASMGDESHIFVKSNDRRIHYNGQAFVVRNAGHSAGFDETGLLRIW